MQIALLSSGVRGANAGDAIIEDSIRRIIGADAYHRFPLREPLTPEDLARINQCDAVVICGTNLYQTAFKCALTPEVIQAITVPIVPMGIGASASIGAIPKMDAAGIATVRALHARCTVSSVRDPATWHFLHSIGVHNTMLTGCPVLFHGLCCPQFDGSGDGFTLTPRARLLHIDPRWRRRQREAMTFLCERYHPMLLLQSPADLPMGEELAARYQLPLLYDAEWQSECYVARARQQSLTFGFRLHFGMLSLSYGKPTYFVAHDTRISEFCRLMQLPCYDITDFRNDALAEQIDGRLFDTEDFRRRWLGLAAEMSAFLSANGLKSCIETAVTPALAPIPPAAPESFAPYHIEGRGSWLTRQWRKIGASIDKHLLGNR